MMSRARRCVWLACGVFGGVSALAACVPAPMEPVGYTVRSAPPVGSLDAAPRGSNGSIEGGDPATVALIGKITREKLRLDMSMIAESPRNHETTPVQLQRASTFIRSELKKASFDVQIQRVQYGGASAVNIIADLKGEDPNHVILLTAHYDSVAQSAGADDDASGVAALLSIARALSGTTPKVGIRIVMFCFEEQGLIGSQQYVSALEREEKEKIVGVFNVEMIGFTDHRPDSQKYPAGLPEAFGSQSLPTTGDFIGVIGRTSDQSLLDALDKSKKYAPKLKSKAIAVPSAALLVMPDLMRSDHAPFWTAGIPAVMLGDTADFRTPHYHQPTDVIDTLDLDFMTQVTRWLLAGVVELANSSATPAPAKK
ncbi:MAG: M28 family peptidase [Polyangiaceae bacterium]